MRLVRLTSASRQGARFEQPEVCLVQLQRGHDDDAASLREGLDETLTVMRLGLTGTLRKTFATTNPIENMNGALRRIARNIKRWKDEAMIRRWVALGISEAQKGFRRVKGHANMPALVAALRPAVTVASDVTTRSSTGNGAFPAPPPHETVTPASSGASPTRAGAESASPAR